MYQRQIIDNFVNSVYAFEDRVVLNFNFKENAKTVQINRMTTGQIQCSCGFFVLHRIVLAA